MTDELWRRWENSAFSFPGQEDPDRVPNNDAVSTFSARIGKLGWGAFVLWGYLLWRVLLGSPEDLWLTGTGAQPWVVSVAKLVMPAMLLGLVALLNRPHWAWGLVYVALWPLHVALWKLPKLVWDKGSWNGVIALCMLSHSCRVGCSDEFS